MRKKVFIIFGALFTFILAFFFYIKVKQNNQKILFVENHNYPILNIASNDKNYKIDPIINNNYPMQAAFWDAMGFEDNTEFRTSSNSASDIRQINIILFEDISHLSKENKSQLKYQSHINEDIIYGIKDIYNPETHSITYVHFSSPEMNKNIWLNENGSKYLTNTVIRNIIFSMESPNLDSLNMRVDSIYTSLELNQKPILIKKQNIIEKIFDKISNVIVKDVYAGCSGSFSCGTTVQDCSSEPECGGGACTGGFCSDFTPCSCTDVCGGVPAPKSCVGENQAACENPSGCEFGQCFLGGFCTWTCTPTNSYWSDWSGTCGNVTRTCLGSVSCGGSNLCTGSSSTCLGGCGWTTTSSWCDSGCGNQNCWKNENDACGAANPNNPIANGSTCNRCNIVNISLSSPANGVSYSNVPSIPFSWTLGTWGNSCGDARSYTLCLSNNQSTCNVASINTGETASHTYNSESLSTDTYYWRVTATNRDQSITSGWRAFNLVNTPKTCTVSLSAQYPNAGPVGAVSATTTVTGQTFASNGDDVRLFVEEASNGNTSINGVPISVSPAADVVGSLPYYYHILTGGCDGVVDSDLCNKDTDITLSTRGDYYFHCDVPSEPNNCSGNPFGLPAGWDSCSDNDNVAFCSGTNQPNPVANLTPANPNITSALNPDINRAHDGTDTSEINITWDAVSTATVFADDANYYDVLIWPQGTHLNSADTAWTNRANANVLDTTVSHTLGTTAYNYAYTATQGDYALNVAVRPINTTCTAQVGDEVGDWTQIAMNIQGDITGSIYEDDGNANCNYPLNENMCDDGGTTISTIPFPLMELTLNQLSDTYTSIINETNITGGANFTFSDPNYIADDYEIILDLTPQIGIVANTDVYTCSAPNDVPNAGADLLHCSYGSATYGSSASGPIDAPQANINFYLKRIDLSNNAWWQIAGGNVYADTSISSDIPDITCDDAVNIYGLPCYSGLITGNPFDTTTIKDTNGFVFTNTGSINTHKDNSPNIDYIHPPSSRDTASDGDDPNNAHAIGADLPQQKYEFFWNKFGSNGNVTDISDSDFSSLGTISTTETNIFYYDGSGGDFTIDEASGWDVDNDEKIIVFIDSNLRINSSAADNNTQIITVTERSTGNNGGYLAFIVSGDINVSEEVGYSLYAGSPGAVGMLPGVAGTQAVLDPAITPPNIEGVYIADGTFTLEDDGDLAGGTYTLADRKFIGAGTFIGWGGVNLNRSFDNSGIGKADNNVNATETFIYRPDLLINEPPEMKASHSNWKEVAPTYQSTGFIKQESDPTPTPTPAFDAELPTPTPEFGFGGEDL